jgi:hypothetical protein
VISSNVLSTGAMVGDGTLDTWDGDTGIGWDATYKAFGDAMIKEVESAAQLQCRTWLSTCTVLTIHTSKSINRCTGNERLKIAALSPDSRKNTQ